jgi:hypothetical protein
MLGTKTHFFTAGGRMVKKFHWLASKFYIKEKIVMPWVLLQPPVEGFGKIYGRGLSC